MGIRNFPRLLAAVNRQIADFYLEMKRNGVDAIQFNPAAGNPLQGGDQPSTHQFPKGIGRAVPAQTRQQQPAREHQPQQVLPYLAPTRRSAGFAHRTALPTPADGASAWISLPARRFCSHAVSS